MRPPAATHFLHGWSPSQRVRRARHGSHALEMRLAGGGAAAGVGCAVDVDGEQLEVSSGMAAL